LNNEVEEKTGRLVEMMAREKLAGVLLNAQHNFAWLTGGGFNGIDTSRENGAATLLVAQDGRRFILANNIEMQRMLSEQVNPADFEPIEFSWLDEKACDDIIYRKASEVLGSADIAADVLVSSHIRPVEKLIAACRYSLTEAEADRFRRLGSDAGKAMRSVIALIQPGESEIEIAAKMRSELLRGGMDSVVTLVAADDRIKKFRHPVPTDNRWQKTLMMVTCAKRHGLIASLTRMVCVGDAPSELLKRTEAAARINARIYSATSPEAVGSDLFKILADAYAATGFANEINLHHQGGAAGYRTRDWTAHPRSSEIVQPNQAFAWNPSITGTKVEETCIVAANGVEVITASPDFPQISTVIDGKEYLSPGILVI